MIHTWHPTRDGFGTLVEAERNERFGGFIIVHNGITLADARERYGEVIERTQPLPLIAPAEADTTDIAPVVVGAEATDGAVERLLAHVTLVVADTEDWVTIARCSALLTTMRPGAFDVYCCDGCGVEYIESLLESGGLSMHTDRDVDGDVLVSVCGTCVEEAKEHNRG